MCGIAGIISKNNEFDILSIARNMASTLKHRGPDDSHIWTHQDCMAMVHTRLSIQDLSPKGSQPMISHNGRYVISYNGEIYNFLKIRKNLSEIGYNFIGHSDTEVLLASIEEYGLRDALLQFEGMFAFSLWDNNENTLHLCRDRMGEKPLYYAWSGSTFLWSSELKAFKGLACWRPEINRSIIPTYLKYGYVPTPNSIYKNCYKLVPGTILSLPIEKLFELNNFSPSSDANDNLIHPKAYWKLNDHFIPENRNKDLNYQDAVEQLDTILKNVIADQMISDVPYGAFLSGGIDSSLVTSIMQSLSKNPINTFTIGFNEKDFNEAGFAKEISQHLGTNHHELYISSTDCLNLVPKLPQMMDEPFADSSALPAYFVSALASKHVTVSLSGDGGDELFCGYNRYTHTQNIWQRVQKLPPFLRNIIAQILLLFPPNMYDNIYNLLCVFINRNAKKTRIGLKVQKLSKLLKMNSINEIYEMLISYCTEPEEISTQEYKSSLIMNHPSLDVLQEENQFIERAMAIDTISYLVDDNLTKVDRTGMASSLETRLPLLNHKVVEFSWQLPLEMKIGKNQPKRILRDILYKRVPKSLIERPKMGFSVPVANWLRNPLKPWAESLLLDSSNLEHGLFNKSALAELWKHHISGRNDNSAALWSILMFQAWYIDQDNSLI
jgi:asparagine synthase (glutamine-hydrolysing)